MNPDNQNQLNNQVPLPESPSPVEPVNPGANPAPVASQDTAAPALTETPAQAAIPNPVDQAMAANQGATGTKSKMPLILAGVGIVLVLVILALVML